MEGVKVYVLLFILTVAMPKAQTENNDNEPEGRMLSCPNFANIANFSNPSEVLIIQNNIMASLWNIKKPKISLMGIELKNVLFDMTKSDVPFWRRYALAASELMWAYLPSLNRNPALCSYASIINATVDFAQNNNCDIILEAIDKSTTAFTEAGFLVTANGIRNANCRPNGIVPETTVGGVCYKNGFVYHLDAIWDTIGWKYPWKLRNIVIKMYRSPDFTDKVMALLTTATLSDFLSVLEFQYPSEPLYRTFAMFTPGYIPARCCGTFIAEAKALSDYVQVQNVEMFKLPKILTNCLIP